MSCENTDCKNKIARMDVIARLLQYHHRKDIDDLQFSVAIHAVMSAVYDLDKDELQLPVFLEFLKENG